MTTAASLIWGTVYVSIGVGLRYLNPYSLLFMRFLIATIFILLISLSFGRKLRLFGEVKKPVNWVLGLVYFLGFVFQYVGQNMTNASDTTLVSNLGPILAPIVALFVLREGLRKNQVLALGMGLVGLFLIAGPRFNSSSTSVIGDLLLFLTSVSYAVFIILGKKFNAGGLGSSFAIIITMTLFSLPFALNSGFNLSELIIAPLGWIAVLWMALPCGLVAISLYLKGLEQVTVSESSMLLLLQVIAGLVLAAALLGERTSIFEIGGAVAISIAVLASAIGQDHTGPANRSRFDVFEGENLV
ncbi:MAG: DMT family transporter [Thaumarchaeota archaeon]|nr:DMT family transporter [Nitrososphaerota archaeon]MDG6906801.1 DMT family transporter [Nitrososphaerota archaeon]